MKTRIAIIAFVLALASTTGVRAADPTTDDSRVVADSGEYYAEIVAKVNNAGGGESVTVDFGRYLPSRLGLRDSDLKRMQQSYSFTSAVDALNFMSAQGWKLVTAYSITGRTGTVNHFVISIPSADPAKVATVIIKPE